MSALVSGRRVRVGAHELLVRDSGGTGPVVLLAHGWPDQSTLWRHVQAALTADGYRTVSFDWLGHGESDTPRELSAYRVPSIGRDLTGVLDGLGIDRAHLVAHDYGATVAWEAVPAAPHRFSSFTAISVGHSMQILRDVATRAPWRYRWLVLHGLRVSRRWYLADEGRRFRQAFASHPDADEVLARLHADTDAFSWTIWERANPSPVVVRRLLRPSTPQRIPMRSLGIFSRQDEWMTEGQLARSGRYIDGPWSFASIDGGHWVPLQDPEAVLAPLRTHLNLAAGGR